MAINVAKASEGSFYPFNESIDLNENIIDNRLAKFITPCEVTGRYVTEDDFVHVDCECVFTVRFQCDRCLADVDREFKIRYAGSYYLEGMVNPPEDYLSYFNGLVDITEGVEEEVLLNLPSRVLCKEDCKGICPICGIDLNYGECNCKVDTTPTDSGRNNPFAVLKDLKNSTGGANNGSTKG